MTHTTKGGGTEGFRAPEVASGRFSAKADMYSLAVTFFDMSVGRVGEHQASIPDMSAEDPCAPLRSREEGGTNDEAAAAMTCELLDFALHTKKDDRPSATDLLSKFRSLKEGASKRYT